MLTSAWPLSPHFGPHEFLNRTNPRTSPSSRSRSMPLSRIAWPPWVSPSTRQTTGRRCPAASIIESCQARPATTGPRSSSADTSVSMSGQENDCSITGYAVKRSSTSTRSPGPHPGAERLVVRIEPGGRLARCDTARARSHGGLGWSSRRPRSTHQCAHTKPDHARRVGLVERRAAGVPVPLPPRALGDRVVRVVQVRIGGRRLRRHEATLPPTRGFPDARNNPPAGA